MQPTEYKREDLALFGGTPVTTTLPSPWPSLGAKEVEAVSDVIRSGKINYWTGDKCQRFESEFAAHCCRKFGVSVANGTLALELALRAFGVGPGDEVIVPARSFFASVGCVVAVGATPVFADIDPQTNAITADSCAPCISDMTKAIIVVHLGGLPAPMEEIIELALENKLVVIEDCAQAHGGTYRGQPLGSLGHAGCFSFCQDKIIPTGEGGMLVLDDEDTFKAAWSYRDHGKSYDLVKSCAENPKDGTSFNWLIESFGSNWRLGELEGALGLAGLSKLERYHQARTQNAEFLIKELSTIPALKFCKAPEDSDNAYYRLYGLIDQNLLSPGWNRDAILQAVTAEGILVQYGSCAELYREDAVSKTDLWDKKRLPGAQQADEESICFFVHPTLTPQYLADTVTAVQKVLSVAAKAEI